MAKNITIKEYAHINIEQLLELYSSVQWTNYTNRPAMLESAIRHSLKMLAAYADDKLVGIIRSVGDGHSILYIQDIIVLPEFQRRGIGRLLVHHIEMMYPDV